MDWLALVGVTLDGVGAALIALPLLVPLPEAREESQPRWDGNPWVIVLRRRERALVQIGASALALGFLFQAAAQVVGLHSAGARTAGVALSALVLVLGVSLGQRVARRGLPKYVIYDDEATRLTDQRDVFHIESVAGWRTLIGAQAQEKTGRPLVEIPERAVARINQGRWIATCPRCNSDTMGWPDNPNSICIGEGLIFPVDYPHQDDLRKIEQLLLHRPNENRNWTPGETLDTLREENRTHGLPTD